MMERGTTPPTSPHHKHRTFKISPVNKQRDQCIYIREVRPITAEPSSAATGTALLSGPHPKAL